MRRRHGWTMMTLVSLALLAPGAATAAKLGGSFEVNNTLPVDGELSVTVTAEGGGEPAAATAVEVAGETIAYSVDGLEPGSYRIDLVAKVGDDDLILTRLAGVTVGDGETTLPPAEAIGVDGAVAGEITLSGEPPADRLLLVRADRTDIEVSGMPDALNRLSFEVSKDEIEGGTLAYEFEGMSYGVYRVELIGYDYRTHEVEVYGALDGTLPIDAESPHATDASFTVEFASTSG